MGNRKLRKQCSDKPEMSQAETSVQKKCKLVNWETITLFHHQQVRVRIRVRVRLRNARCLKLGDEERHRGLWRMSNLTIFPFIVFKMSGFLIYRAEISGFLLNSCFQNFLFLNFPFPKLSISQFTPFPNYRLPMHRFPVYRFPVYRFPVYRDS